MQDEIGDFGYKFGYFCYWISWIGCLKCIDW
jgi:hypothetical protein